MAFPFDVFQPEMYMRMYIRFEHAHNIGEQNTLWRFAKMKMDCGRCCACDIDEDRERFYGYVV
jgi:hypothetical protein